MGDLVDPTVAGRSLGPTASMAIAEGREPITAAPAVFGTIRPRLVRPASSPASGKETTGHMPRRIRAQVLHELDDGEDAVTEGGTDLFNPVGGAGAVGRLLQRLLGRSRSTGSGTPGAEAATHRTRRGGGVAGGAVVSSQRSRPARTISRTRPDRCPLSRVEYLSASVSA